jgi:hypothetical protein
MHQSDAQQQQQQRKRRFAALHHTQQCNARITREL